jgi:hypothetical protein
VKTAVLLASLVLIHALLLRWAANRNVASAILSGGTHIPIGDLGLAVGLMAVRLVMFLLAPALLVRDLVASLLICRAARAIRNHHLAFRCSQCNDRRNTYH